MPDGSERSILVSSVAIRDDAGNYDGAVHTLSDITALRDSEKEQALLAAIVNSSQDAIIAKDLNGVIKSWNPSAERLFGYSAKEAIGHHVNLIIPHTRLREEQLIIEKISRGENVEHFETERINKADHIIPVSLTISPVRNKEGKIVGASNITRDITQQKKIEEQLQSYMAHLEEIVQERTKNLNQELHDEKELSQLKSRFVSMASHEFKTPLTSIKLSATLIEKYAEVYGNQQITKHLIKIKNSVSNLSAVLNDFLSLEMMELGKTQVSPHKFNLTEFCREAVTEMQMLSKAGQQIIYKHSGLTETVLLDEQLLKNCLNNLLSNAIKYSGENTIIQLTTEINKDGYLITVEDRGIGIPEADKKNLFSAFFRAGNTGQIQGTGLGLNIVTRYVGLMGGSISFESKIGEGATFKLFFPIKQG